jgi:hypothetical protein
MSVKTDNILKQSLTRSGRDFTGNLRKEEIMSLYSAKNPTLASYRLPKLSEYFKELNIENMSSTS